MTIFIFCIKIAIEGLLRCNAMRYQAYLSVCHADLPEKCILVVVCGDKFDVFFTITLTRICSKSTFFRLEK